MSLRDLITNTAPTPIKPKGEHWCRYEGYEHPRVEYYRVKRHTPCGVWLDMGYGVKDKFVLNNARRRFAYPTEAEALDSFIIRKLRQIEHNQNFGKLAHTALEMLDPDLSEEQKKRIKYFLTKHQNEFHFDFTFNQWWRNVGSGITPEEGHDMEEHAKRIARIAWQEAQS